MENALSVIQPSKFEGWSTVIEDAMSMNQTVIASSIDVNREQLGDEGIYFNQDDFIELGNSMLSLLEFKPQIDYEYSNRVIEFANGIINFFNND